MPAKVAAIEYDPNRSARIALLHYADGAKAYILAPAGLQVGAIVESGPEADIKPGNALPLANIPTGTLVHNVELQPGQGRPDGALAPARASSSSPRTAATPCCASPRARCAACCSSAARRSVRSATSTTRTSPAARPGRSRWMGKRPTVRGSAMNPVDHPHGGGEGKSKGGRHPVTPWGVPTLGKRTRKKHKTSDKLIIRSAGVGRRSAK